MRVVDRFGRASLFQHGPMTGALAKASEWRRSVMTSIRVSLAVSVLVCCGMAQASNPVLLRPLGDDQWGQGGHVNAMNDVFGNGMWQDLRWENINPKDVFSANNDCIFIEGGNSGADKMETFINSNQALIENWVASGGRLLINSAPNVGDGMSLGFGGVQLNYWDGDGAGVAVDLSHPVYDGPYGTAGGFLNGSSWNHASVTGGGISPITLNSGNGNPNLAELPWGGGHVLFGGLTLDFFYSHGSWTQPDSNVYFKNLLAYTCVPTPGAASLLGLAGLAAARRRR
jgi:hypothetical protein